jgi:hypothetical protein
MEGNMSKERQGNIEVDIKDKDTIYIRDKQTDNWIKLDIIGFLRLLEIIETVKERDHNVLKQLKEEYLLGVDEIYNSAFE